MSEPTLPIEQLALEAIFERLTQVVEQLEKGDLPLERALAMFEEGVKLTREGQRRLDAAEQRIEALVSTAPTHDEPKTKPFQPPGAR